MNKSIIFLADGMADLPIKELGNKTPLDYAYTPNMDLIAKNGASGTFLSLPAGFPTSSDVANMSVLGYDLAKCYPGRGSIEAVSQGVKLADDEIAWRCNLITVEEHKIKDYSAGHIKKEISDQIIDDLQKEFGNDKIKFVKGVSYRNLLILKGDEFSPDVEYAKPDSSHGGNIYELGPKPLNDSVKAKYTSDFLTDLIAKAATFCEKHPLNEGVANPANYIWPWSPGYRPNFSKFSDKYNSAKGAIISAVDVILGIGMSADMTICHVEGATGFIDTNYKGKAEAAIEAIKTHDFVYLHIEAMDECSHMGDLKLKISAIEDFDKKIVGPVLDACKDKGISFTVLPDHPVPISLRKHTRTPVPFAVWGDNIAKDEVDKYTEELAMKGSLGIKKDDELMRLVMGI